MRHYAFAHKKIYDFCDEEELNGIKVFKSGVGEENGKGHVVEGSATKDELGVKRKTAAAIKTFDEMLNFRPISPNLPI